jgi:hypothetical protein
MLIKVIGQRVVDNGDVLGFANSLDVHPRFMVRPTDGKLYYYTINGITGTIYITIQYTKTTDTPEVPQRGNVIYLPTIYSEEEREVGVWTDGKPLYQKSITLTHIPNKELVTINHGIANIDEITEIKGTCFANLTVAPNHASTMLPRIQDNVTYANMGIDVDRTVIYLKGRDEDFEEIYDKIVVTLQYTKTTDAPGSGTWTPSGVPAVHYSTEEQVVGTWVDGKTVYQDTIYFQGSLPEGR